MWNLYDIAYGIGLAVSSPYWLSKESARAKVHKALAERMGDEIPQRNGDEPGNTLTDLHGASFNQVCGQACRVWGANPCSTSVRQVC